MARRALYCANTRSPRATAAGEGPEKAGGACRSVNDDIGGGLSLSLSLFFSLSLSKLSRATSATLHLRERLREESGRCEKEKREAVLLLGEEKEAK